MIIDAHTHVVSHDEQRFPLAAAELPNGAWWADGRYDVDQLLAEMDGAGVDGVVLVQATGPYSFDNRYLVDAHRRHRRRTAAVCTLDVDPRRDPTAPSRAAQDLAVLVDTEGIAGLRLFALDFDGGEGWIAEPRTAPVWELLAASGIPAVATVFAAQLPALATMVERYPTVTVCLDHCAFPDFANGAAAALETLLAIAHLPNLVLKVTTFLLGGGPPDVVGEALELLREHVGAERLMWGSDYPQAHDRSYAELVQLAEEATQHWGQTERERFMAGTAAAVWPGLAG